MFKTNDLKRKKHLDKRLLLSFTFNSHYQMWFANTLVCVNTFEIKIVYVF